MGRLDGKVAIVTGAGQGIGRGISLAFASEGAKIVVAEINEDTAASTVEEVRGRGSEGLAVGCDVRRRADVNRCVARCIEMFSAVDILVNNAVATVTGVSVAETSDEDVALAWESGFLGTLYFLQACYPHMKGRNAKVINFGSGAGVDGLAGFAAYGPAKEAIRSLTKVAAHEWGKEGIRVNCICPSAASPSWERWAAENPAFIEAAMAHSTSGRMGDCEQDIGRAALFLASDDSSYVTGHTLMVDGGSCRW
jgi:NAD(P)-dependent dehydrogenase (short-subunit alcohol dehydrogenase family)